MSILLFGLTFFSYFYMGTICLIENYSNLVKSNIFLPENRGMYERHMIDKMTIYRFHLINSQNIFIIITFRKVLAIRNHLLFFISLLEISIKWYVSVGIRVLEVMNLQTIIIAIFHIWTSLWLHTYVRKGIGSYSHVYSSVKTDSRLRNQKKGWD